MYFTFLRFKTLLFIAGGRHCPQPAVCVQHHFHCSLDVQPPWAPRGRGGARAEGGASSLGVVTRSAAQTRSPCDSRADIGGFYLRLFMSECPRRRRADPSLEALGTWPVSGGPSCGLSPRTDPPRGTPLSLCARCAWGGHVSGRGCLGGWSRLLRQIAAGADF